LVFRWIFTPWLQKELDAYRERVNNTAKRADCSKILPHGVPTDILECTEMHSISSCIQKRIPILLKLGFGSDREGGGE
ncbi:hypothetical protein DFH09DRAFT_912476, partial [Mycena vulgaris]